MQLRRIYLALCIALAISGCGDNTVAPEPAPDPKPQPPARVAQITVSPSADSLDLGDEIQFTAVLRDSAGNTLTGRKVEWASGSPEFITIDAEGRARVIKNNRLAASGAPEIRITAASGEQVGEARMHLHVHPGSLLLDLPGRILLGRNRLAGATVLDGFGWPAGARKPSDFSWSSSDAAVVAVAPTGEISALRVGKAVITAAVGGIGRSDTVEVVDRGYVLTRLGTLGGAEAIPHDLNDRGQIVGRSRTASGEWHAFEWLNGRLRDLGTAGEASAAHALNNQGVVVGMSRNEAVRWVNGELRSLSVSWQPTDIDEQGRILLYRNYPSLLLWERGDTSRVGAASPDLYVWYSANGINASGVVVGSALSRTPSAVAISAGRLTVIDASRYDASAAAINDAGQIVGHAGIHPARLVLAFIWHNGQRTSIGPLGGTATRPKALNEKGEVVGVATNSRGEPRAFYWFGGRTTDLTDLLRDPVRVLVEVSAINESGQIVGLATNGSTGAREAVLLTPE